MQAAALCFLISLFPLLRHRRPAFLQHHLDGFNEWRFFVVRLLPPIGVKLLDEIRRAHLQRHNHRLQIPALHQHHHHKRIDEHKVCAIRPIVGNIQQVAVCRRPRHVVRPPDNQAVNPVFGVERHIFFRPFGRRRFCRHASRFLPVLCKRVSHNSLPITSRLTLCGAVPASRSASRIRATYKPTTPVSLTIPMRATVSTLVIAFIAWRFTSSFTFISSIIFPVLNPCPAAYPPAFATPFWVGRGGGT